MTRKEIIHIFENSSLVSKYFTDEAVDAVYVEALAALREQRWIPTEERLPETEEFVLVIVNGKPHRNMTLENACELAEYIPGEGWVLEMWPEWESPDVTHWMPLPEPPKGIPNEH